MKEKKFRKRNEGALLSHKISKNIPFEENEILYKWIPSDKHAVCKEYVLCFKNGNYVYYGLHLGEWINFHMYHSEFMKNFITNALEAFKKAKEYDIISNIFKEYNKNHKNDLDYLETVMEGIRGL